MGGVDHKFYDLSVSAEYKVVLMKKYREATGTS